MEFYIPTKKGSFKFYLKLAVIIVPLLLLTGFLYNYFEDLSLMKGRDT